MTTQEYIKKNNDLQKYVGRYSDCGNGKPFEILSIQMYAHDDTIHTTEAREDNLTPNTYIDLEHLIKCIEFPKNYICMDDPTDEMTGMMDILRHHGHKYTSGSTHVSFQEMKAQTIKLLSKKEEIKEEEEIKEGDVLVCFNDSSPFEIGQEIPVRLCWDTN